jgi:hypothetical protein
VSDRLRTIPRIHRAVLKMIVQKFLHRFCICYINSGSIKHMYVLLNYCSEIVI